MTAYDMRISDCSSDVCSSDLLARRVLDYGSNKPAGDGHGHRNIDAGEFKHLVACALHIAFRYLHERYGQRLDQQVINGQFDATARKPRSRKSVGQAKRVSVRVHSGGRRRINNQTKLDT